MKSRPPSGPKVESHSRRSTPFPGFSLTLKPSNLSLQRKIRQTGNAHLRAFNDTNPRQVDLLPLALNGATSTLAGSGTGGFLDGDGAVAKFNYPRGIAIDPSGTFALVAVRWPPPYPRIPPSRRRHTRLAHTA